MAGAALVSAGVGVYKAVQGKKAAEKAAEEAEKARGELEKHKADFANLDTSNPYKGMKNVYADQENTMEDLTVNQQASEFEKQQQMQSQANILGQNRASAGSSGIAALAQSLSNEGALAAQKASVGIGEQEAANQKSSTAEASRLQDQKLSEDSRLAGLERDGELKSRQMQADKVAGMMGLSAGDVNSATAMQTQAQNQVTQGWSDAAGGVGSAVGSIHDYNNRVTGDDVDDILNP